MSSTDPSLPRLRFSTLRLALLPALFASLASSSLAQSPPATGRESDETIILPEFTTVEAGQPSYNATDATSTSRIRSEIVNTPQSISVVTPEFIRAVAPVKLFDVVAYTAGVSEGTSAGYFGNRMSLRGFPSIQNAFVDGVSGSNFEFPQVERIEVLKGPNSILAPTGLPGGTINVITKSPQFQRSGSLTATVGQFDAQRITLDTTGPLEMFGSSGENLAYRFVASYQNTDRFQEHTERTQYILLPALTWSSGATTVTLKWNYNWSNPTMEGRQILAPWVGPDNPAEPYPGVPADAYFNEPGLHRKSVTNQPTLTVNSHLTRNIATRFFAVYSDDFYDHETIAESFAIAPGGAINPSTGLWTPGTIYGPGPGYTPAPAPLPDVTAATRRASAFEQRAKRTIIQNDYVGVWNLPFSIKSTTVAGWSYTRTRDRLQVYFGSASPINFFNPVYGLPITRDPPVQDSRNTQRDINAFLMERLEAAGGRLQLNAGIQRLGSRRKAHNQLNDAVRHSRIHATTYLYNALWKVNDVTSVYYSYSENAAPANSGIPETPLLLQNGEQDEVGVKWEPFNRRLRITAAAYEISQLNLQYTNPARLADPTAPAFLFSDVKSRGWEIEMSGALTKNIMFMGNYSRARIRDPWDRPLRGAADTSAAAFVGYRFDDGALKGLSLNVGVIHQGKRPGDAATGFTALGVPIQPSFYLPAYTIVKLGADYSWNNYTFQLTVDNALDETYIQSALNRDGLFMGSGRNVLLTTTLKF